MTGEGRGREGEMLESPAMTGEREGRGRGGGDVITPIVLALHFTNEVVIAF